MSDPIIELQNVEKSFGRNRVLEGLNLRVEVGKTYAFLGRNGAGKTTTIRMLMGLIRPDCGRLRILGLDPADRRQALEIRRQVGYLAEDQQMWGWMTVGEAVGFMAPFYPSWDMAFAQELLAKFALPTTAKVKHLSKGQNVRLGLLLALAHRPRVVVLDDPALGLDPIMRKEFLRDVVGYLQGSETTVFFSSHLLYEVEPVADVVGILDRGRMVREADTEDLRDQVKRLLLTSDAWDRVKTEVTGILDLRRDGRQVAIVTQDAQRSAAAMRQLGVEPEVHGLNLDEIFEAYVIGRQAGDPDESRPADNPVMIP